MTEKPTLKLRTPSESTDGPPLVARMIWPERLYRLHDMARVADSSLTTMEKI